MAPLIAVAAALRGFNREQVGSAIEVLSALMDVADDEPDIEQNGHELDGTGSEDDFFLHSSNWLGEPGCPISDPDTSVEDDPHGFDPETDYGADDVGEPDADDECRDEFSDPVVRAGHRRRIQRARCFGRHRRFRDWL